jgi:5-methylcytosine-specific restriction endonuclease McrA
VLHFHPHGLDDASEATYHSIDRLVRLRRRREAANDIDSQPDEDSGDSLVSVKDAVRQRDEHRCQDCGMTASEHLEKFSTKLHVHRIVPGLSYSVNWCVTLCQSCHGKKPKKLQDGYWASDLRWFGFNLYDAEDRALWEMVVECCHRYDLHPSEVIQAGIRALHASQSPDYCI